MKKIFLLVLIMLSASLLVEAEKPDVLNTPIKAMFFQPNQKLYNSLVREALQGLTVNQRDLYEEYCYFVRLIDADSLSREIRTINEIIAEQELLQKHGLHKLPWRFTLREYLDSEAVAKVVREHYGLDKCVLFMDYFNDAVKLGMSEHILDMRFQHVDEAVKEREKNVK